MGRLPIGSAQIAAVRYRCSSTSAPMVDGRPKKLVYAEVSAGAIVPGRLELIAEGRAGRRRFWQRWCMRHPSPFDHLCDEKTTSVNVPPISAPIR